MEESIQVVTLEGADTKWGKDRVKRHGPVFELVRRGMYLGEPAVLCRSLKAAYRDGSKWSGWFILDKDARIVPRPLPDGTMAETVVLTFTSSDKS